MYSAVTGEQIEAINKMVQIKVGKRIEKFNTPSIRRALRFAKWHAKRYKEGLLMEIIPEDKH